MNVFQAIILAIIEGLTEFLPVSSTGHMIIASSVMGIASDDFTKLFTIAIQFGAILSVVVLYFKRFFKSFQFYYRLFIAFIPAAILGKLLNDYIDAMLENVVVVGFTLMAGGIFLLFVDKIFRKNETEGADAPDYPSAFKIGLFQCLAMIPGVSRSAATIIGGMTMGLNRKSAAEFSFFLAVPTMFAATVYKMYSYFQEGYAFHSDQLILMVLGNIVAFIVAMLAIRSFISWLTQNGFRVFGWYRIILGMLILILAAAGVDLNIL
jgi:undecaprenyl-diphosphatase